MVDWQRTLGQTGIQYNVFPGKGHQRIEIGVARQRETYRVFMGIVNPFDAVSPILGSRAGIGVIPVYTYFHAGKSTRRSDTAYLPAQGIAFISGQVKVQHGLFLGHNNNRLCIGDISMHCCLHGNLAGSHVSKTVAASGIGRIDQGRTQHAQIRSCQAFPLRICHST